MKTNFTAKRALIKSVEASNDFLALYGIYKDTIKPDIEYNMFKSMYCSDELMSIDFTLFTVADKRAGFSAVFFYKTQMNGKAIFIARSATGLLEEFQGKGMHNVADLYVKFMRFAVAHPFTPIYAVAFIINPFVFSELCRFVPQFFPMPNKDMPEDIKKMMEEIIVNSGHTRDLLYPYRVKVPIQIKVTNAMMKRISCSKDENIKWFMDNITDLSGNGILDKYGLPVIVKVSLRNISGTLLNLGSYYYPKNKRTVKQQLAMNTKKVKLKAEKLLKKIFQKWTL